LEIAECTGYMQGGGKKDDGFIAGLFLPHMKIIDPDRQLIDCVFFDGASKVQKRERLFKCTINGSWCYTGRSMLCPFSSRTCPTFKL
jgi:hypothetical protein